MKNTNPEFQPLTYAGGLYDSDTKLIRFGARDYDPTIGRWTTKDPIGFAGGDTNLYAYVGGNPMSYTDRSGLTQADLDEALRIYRKMNPQAFEGNPTFTNADLSGSSSDDDANGRTLSATEIQIDFAGLDKETPAGPDRIARYIQTVSHELQHANDLRRLGYPIGKVRALLPWNHNQIRDKAFCDRAKYEGVQYSCCPK